jgi:proline dehydrogenase
MLLRTLILRVAGRQSFERFVRNSRLTRRVVRRFIAGDTLDEAIGVAEELVHSGFRVTLDLLGENTKTAVDADKALAEYQRMLDEIHRSPYSGGSMPENINISIKLTQLGLLLDGDATQKRLESLLASAGRYRNFVRIDMEDSACTEPTLAAVVRAFPAYRNVGVALQAMLYRTKGDVEEMIRAGIRVRLVKGAYLEPASVAHQEKLEVDRAYLECAMRLLSAGVFPAFGTHDGRIINAIIARAERDSIDPKAFEFQFLHGIRRDLQADLKDRGFGVRVYVPYGSSWYPYFTRRLAERPANLFFFLRSLFGR